MGSIARIIKYGKKCKDEMDFKSFSLKNIDWKKIIWPFRVLTHPIQAFTEIKYEKRGSVLLGIIVLALWFFSSIFDYLEKGFVFNTNLTQMHSMLKKQPSCSASNIRPLRLEKASDAR